MVASRTLFAGVALGLIACAFVAGTLPEPGRLVMFALAAAAAVVLAYNALSVPAERPAQPLSADLAPMHASELAVELDDVIEAVPVGVIIVGGDGRIRAFNRAAAEIFDVPGDRAPGRALIEIVRSYELDRRLSAALRDGVGETGEITHAGLKERRLQVSTRTLRDRGGQPEALAIITDLTRIRELEALRRDFVSNVSHELRTPLTAVKLMVETLRSGVEPAAAAEFLTSIGRETERMITLVEDLLDLARLETGKFELRLSTIDVGELCREVVTRQSQRALSLGLKLEARTPAQPLHISADRDKLYQVLVNLLDNALRHTPDGGAVSVTADRVNGSINLTVQDNGSGIPSTALAHIFERFYVVDAARTRSRSGTGLGLAIVKHIIEAHGGSVAVESELGVGTIFRCTLRAQ